MPLLHGLKHSHVNHHSKIKKFCTMITAMIFMICSTGDVFGGSLLGSDRQYIHAYFGQMANFSLTKAVSLQEWNKFGKALPSYMIALGGGLDYDFCDKILSLGVEVDYASHWGKNDVYTGEIGVALMGRFHANNISKYLPFILGLGDGFSYAIGVPRE